jgi:hypothetical protein
MPRSPSEWFRHPASCEFKSVFTHIQMEILRQHRPDMNPRVDPRARPSCVKLETRSLSKWSLPSNFLHGSFNGPTQEYQRTVHSHAEHPLYSAACGSPEGPGRQRDDECRRRVGNCVEPDLTRATATSHASPNLSPLSPLRCSPCTVVGPSLCVPPSRAFGAAERRQAAAATSALTSPARSLASSALRTLHS